jgi:hypothetical protein
LPGLEIEVRVVLTHPAVGNGVFGRTLGIRVCFLCLPEPLLKPFSILRVPEPPSTASVIWQGVFVAIRLVPSLIPEREAAVRTEAGSVGWNKPDRLCGSHEVI